MFLVTLKLQKAQDHFRDLIYEHGGEMADWNYRDTIHSAGVMAGVFLGSRYKELKAEHDEQRAKFKRDMEAHISKQNAIGEATPPKPQ